MNTKTKLKLLLPVLYAVAATALIIATWPKNAEINSYLGALITLASFVFWIIARVQLGNAFSLAPKSKFVVKSGLYSKLRHPVYYFSITAVLGIVVYSWSLLGLAALLLLICVEIVRIRAEEKLLIKTFGKEYLTYRQGTWF